MQAGADGSARIRFGVFELELRTGELRRTGALLRLSPQPFKVLVLLVSRPGQLVTRDEFRREIWGNKTFVDFEHGLNFAIKTIRDTLGDNAGRPRYIETLPRRGYRFIAPVEWLNSVDSVFETAPEPRSVSDPASALLDPNRAVRAATRRVRWSIWLSLSGALVLACAAAIWLVSRPTPPPRITNYAQLTHDRRFKEVAAADTTRIYVNLLDPDAILQLPLTGGDLVPIPIRVPGEERPIPDVTPGDFPYVYDLSLDGSTFLCSGPSFSLWSVAATGSPIRHLGQAHGAAWSPDGKSVVYAWQGNVLLIRSDGTGSRLLVPSSAFPSVSVSDSDLGWWPEGSLSWSPDGSRIRFTRNHDLWEVSPSGSDLHLLLPGWQPSSWKSSGRWSHQDRRVARRLWVAHQLADGPDSAGRRRGN